MTRGELICRFIETHCRIPDGRDVGQPIRLRGWQREWIHSVYNRRMRRALFSLGRKNGKTALVACLVLAHLVGPETVRNGQIYSAAQAREQAAIVFKLAAKMVRMDPDLARLVHIRDSLKEMVCPEFGTSYRALSAEASTSYGLSPVFVVHDELGQVRGPRSELYDALESAMGAHADPLSIIISTQAPDDGDLLSILIDDAKSEASPTTTVTIYEASKGCDLLDEAAWKAANPALGDFLNIETFREAAEKAARMPAAEGHFRNYLLNQRVASTNAFLSADVWKLGAGEPDLSVFEDYPSWWGLDLSARQDLTALVGVCRTPDGLLHVDARFFAPQDGVRDRSDRDRAPYDVWGRQGFLVLTAGRSVDYGVVAEHIGEIMARGPVQAIAFDRYRMDQLKLELARLAIEAPLVPHGQGFVSMAPALDAFEVEALGGKLRHGMHPVLTWNAANAVVTMDPAGNRKLNKAKSSGRIDGAVSLAMAVGIMASGVAGEMPLPPSPWETEDFRIMAI